MFDLKKAVRALLFTGLFAITTSGQSATVDYKWDFSETPLNTLPTNCFSLVGGNGKPGEWKVLMDEYPLALAPQAAGVSSTAPKAVVAQTAWDPTDEHFPMLQLGTNTYKDFKFTTHFKIVDGAVEQMAGVAFRMQNPKNYYYVRASAMGNTFYFYKVMNGERQAPIGNSMVITKGVWHELTIQCEGSKINISIDGTSALPTMTDLTFSSGRIALWTKSDSVSYFTETHITYTPKVPFVKTLVDEAVKEHKALVGLQLTKVDAASKTSIIVASKNEAEVGLAGESTDAECISDGKNYFRKEGKLVYVSMPLRDRNGDAVAVARFVMKALTAVNAKENALLRATPILKEMEARVSAVDSLD